MSSRGIQCWCEFSRVIWASLVAQMVKNLPAMQETQVQSLGQENPLEKGMATHSSILAWRIPWTEEPGRLQSMGFPRPEYWSGLPFLSPGDLSDPGIKPKSPVSPALADGFFATELPGRSLHSNKLY